MVGSIATPSSDAEGMLVGVRAPPPIDGRLGRLPRRRAGPLRGCRAPARVVGAADLVIPMRK